VIQEFPDHVAADIAGSAGDEYAHSVSPRKDRGLIAKATGPKPVKYREGIGWLRDRRIVRIEIDRDQGSNSGSHSL
jgi:hypothetical protein